MNMERIKNELKESSILTEFLQWTTTCWLGNTLTIKIGPEAMVASIDLLNTRQRQW